MPQFSRRAPTVRPFPFNWICPYVTIVFISPCKMTAVSSTMDCFTVLLHSLNGRHCLPLRLYRETVSGLWKTMGISTGYLSPWCIAIYPKFIADKGSHNVYLDQSIIKPNGSHVSNPTDSPTVTRLGLCNSLTQLPQHKWWHSANIIFKFNRIYCIYITKP